MAVPDGDGTVRYVDNEVDVQEEVAAEIEANANTIPFESVVE